MSTETPETPVAATPPTVDLVAELLTEADNELHDGYDWKLHLGADGNVVGIGVEPFADDGTRLPEVHFRAVVVEGEGPVVIASPEFLAAARAMYRAHVIGASLPPEEYARAIYERQEALDALTPEQIAVLAGEENGGGDDA